LSDDQPILLSNLPAGSTFIVLLATITLLVDLISASLLSVRFSVTAGGARHSSEVRLTI
jgi:hypothetical protein